MSRRPHVALIVEASSAYGQQILRGIMRYLRAHEPWSIFLEQRAWITRPPAWLMDWQGDGVISRTLDRPLALALRASGIPVVDLTDRHGDFGLPRIRSDDDAIGRMAAEHLLQRGFRNLAYCGFARESWSKRRLDGFAASAAQAGLTCRVYESPWHGVDRHPWEKEQEGLAGWLRSLPRPSGVLACSDVRGQHVLDACGRLGLAVPEEVAVVGVDNDELLCGLCNPPLSSVVPNSERIGYLAAELLDRLMAGETAEEPERAVGPLGLSVRQSSDLLAIDDSDIASAVKFIREHACRGITVDDVLAHLPLSRSILERRFRKYLGRSPQEMIIKARIKRVEELLLETDLALDRISTLAGFKHPEHMCVVFKREVGMTPGAFRRQSRG